jgi:ribose-phosphate pyrophosphokinase
LGRVRRNPNACDSIDVADSPTFQDLRVFTGNAHPELADAICMYMEMPLGEAEVFEFSNENIFVQFRENIRARDVFIVQTMSPPVNTRIMELFIMIDAARRASAGRITAVVPYYPYGRSDKKDQPRVPITARLIANFLETAGADRLLTVDLHAGQIQGFFNIPVDELTALSLLSEYFQKKKVPKLTVVATDVGGAKGARRMADRLGAPLAIVEKRRLGNEEKVEALTLIGEVDGRAVLIPDDEVLTGSTLVATAEVVLERGATEVYAAATHPILSGDAVSKLEKSPIKELVFTDTIPVPPEKLLPNMTVLSVAPMLGEAIRRIHTGQSVGALFNGH